MKKDLNELKKLVVDLARDGGNVELSQDQTNLINKFYQEVEDSGTKLIETTVPRRQQEDYEYVHEPEDDFETHEEVEESLSLEEQEKELIQKALEKHKGKRKYAAAELGISERTLYRKIKEYNLN
jgi:transcriptional regulator with PAS, ATPase and Fis domain